MKDVIIFIVIGIYGGLIGASVVSYYWNEEITDMKIDAVMLNHGHWDVNGEFDWNPDAELNMTLMKD